MSGEDGVISEKTRIGFKKELNIQEKKKSLYTLQSTPSKMNTFRTWLQLFKSWIALSPRGGRYTYFTKNWVQVCGMLPETLTLFQTQVCDFSQPYFRPDQKFDTLFQTCLIISSIGQTNVKGNVYMLLLSRIQNCTKFQA